MKLENHNLLQRQLNHFDGITVEGLMLTPENAADFLSKNISNRPLSNATVRNYAQAIERGEWRLNGEALIFCDDGSMASGQHRCHAVLNSGVSIPVLVVRGISRDAFPTMDIGRKRSGADSLGISGESNTHRLSAAARAFIVYDMTHREILSISPSQILDCVTNHPDVRYWLQRVCATGAGKNVPAGLAGLFAKASEKHGIEKFDPLMDQILTGIGLEDGAPALVLRERLAARSATNVVTGFALEAFVIKTINAHIQGKKLSMMRWKSTEQRPVIIGVPKKARNV